MTREPMVSGHTIVPDEADALSLRLIDYWQRLRDSRWAPTRQDIDPVELKSWLGRVHLWEQLDDGDFRCRIWGTQISEMTGSIRDGSRASTMWPSPYGATVFGQYQRTMESRQPTLHRMTFAFLGHSWTYDRVSLPLAPTRHTPPMLLNYTSLGDRQAWRRLWNELEKIADGNWTRIHRGR